jgi:hypothetical protein
VVEILERGAVSFLAVPRGGSASPRGPRDLARLFVVLAPEGRRPLRRISVRRRCLPAAPGAEQLLARVDRIARAPGPLTEDVRAHRGDLAARILGVGHYALARHQGHVHLAYALARACARGDLAAALGVGVGGSFVLSVSRSGLRRSRRSRARSPLAAATPARLDVLGAEVALAASGTQVERSGRPAPDRVGDALVGALLRRGPRPRVASFARAQAPRRQRARAVRFSAH